MGPACHAFTTPSSRSALSTYATLVPHEDANVREKNGGVHENEEDRVWQLCWHEEEEAGKKREGDKK